MAVGVRQILNSSSYLSTPDHADFDVTSSFDVRFAGIMNWQDTIYKHILSCYQGNLAGGGYIALRKHSTAGCFGFYWNSVGGNTTTPVSFANGEAGAIRAVFDETANTFTLYERDDWANYKEDTGWTLVQSVTAAQPILTSDNSMYFGSSPHAQTLNFSGTIYGMEYRVDGVVVADYSPAHAGTRHRDSTGKIWTQQSVNSWTTIIDSN